MLPENTIYIFALPEAVSEQATHVRVTQEIRDGNRTNVHGEYGVLNAAGTEWTPAEKMFAFGIDIRGADRADLVIGANAAGRPTALGDHDIRSSDVLAWLEEDPAVRETRIVARRPAPPVVEDPAV